MNSDLKQKWIEALRSKKYQQGSGALRSCPLDVHKSEFCCLGVLADIINPDGWKYEYDYERWVWSPLQSTEYDNTPFSTFCHTHMGIETRKTINLNREKESVLVAMNDGGRTFDQIADYIEGKM